MCVFSQSRSTKEGQSYSKNNTIKTNVNYFGLSTKVSSNHKSLRNSLSWSKMPICKNAFSMSAVSGTEKQWNWKICQILKV